MKHKITLIFFLPLLALMCVHPAMAAETDWAGVSSSTMSIYQFTSNVFAAGLLSMGVVFFGSACLKYKYYRDNPSQTPIGQPVTHLVLALILLAFATFISVSQRYVYSDDKTENINKAFVQQAKPATQAAPPLTRFAQAPTQPAQDPNAINLDAPYL